MLVHADHALARRLEAGEARIGRELVEALAGFRPGGALLEVAGGVAAFAGPQSPLSHALGLGMSGPVSALELDRMEEFYRERGGAANVDVCPLADPSLPEQLGARGYCPVEFNQVLVRTLPAHPEGVHPEGVTIRRARLDEGRLYSRTVVRGFFERDESTPDEDELGLILFAMASAECHLAFRGDQAAGAGGMTVIGDVAHLFGDATPVPHRGRGIQRGLIASRLASATAAGCTLATASTLPGSLSQRNYERAGFRVVYTKLAFQL